MPIYRPKKSFTNIIAVCIITFAATAVLFVASMLGQEYGVRAAQVDFILKEKSDGAYH